MPTKEQLPDGPHREFVEELFTHYRTAGRPPLRTISAWIKEHAETAKLRGTASTETIRRTMTGLVIPSNWLTVETILEALCGIGDRRTDEDRWPDDGYRYNDPEPSRTFKEELKLRWNALIDHYESNPPELPPRPAPPAPAPVRPSVRDDPWATSPNNGSDEEEPPF